MRLYALRISDCSITQNSDSSPAWPYVSVNYFGMVLKFHESASNLRGAKYQSVSVGLVTVWNAFASRCVSIFVPDGDLSCYPIVYLYALASRISSSLVAAKSL